MTTTGTSVGRMTEEGGPSNRGDILESYQTTQAAPGLSGIAGGTIVTPREELRSLATVHDSTDEPTPVDGEELPV